VRVRSGFVTNSSSVTYIMAVPDNFTISLIEMNHLFDSGDLDFCDCEENPEAIQALFEDVLKHIENLKKGDMLHQDDCAYRESFSVIRECLYSNNLEIKSIDSNSDGDYKIIPVTQEIISKVLTQMSIYDGTDILTNIINKQGKKRNE